MADIKIYVEGIADKQFIKCLIEFVLPNTYKIAIEILGGIDEDLKILNNRQAAFQINTDLGGINLLILDANGDCEKRKEDIARICSEGNIELQLFLLPNNANNGNLENLLCEVINPSHKAIFECYEQYQQCLESNRNYNVPDLKAKVYAYLSALLKNSKFAKEEFRNYLNPDHWDLNNSYLNPLKEFLLAHIQPSAQ